MNFRLIATRVTSRTATQLHQTKIATQLGTQSYEYIQELYIRNQSSIQPIKINLLVDFRSREDNRRQNAGVQGRSVDLKNTFDKIARHLAYRICPRYAPFRRVLRNKQLYLPNQMK